MSYLDPEQRNIPECRCNLTGYCPHCGTYQPAVHDIEILQIIYPERYRASSRRLELQAQEN